jgi:membrane protein DedA with SNARE-associated domain
MGERIFELLRAHFQHHGYLTVAGALLLENAGVPVPGESILLFASFLAFSEHELRLGWIIVVATVACTLGDNIGYAIGHHGGRPLLERWKHLFHVKQSHLERGERLFARFGPAAIFFARFLFGMRIIAGPLAGVLRMPWKEFALFNLLGAATWVTVISSAGYLFGQHWQALIRVLKEVDLGIFIVLALLVFGIWWRRKVRRVEEDGE